MNNQEMFTKVFLYNLAKKIDPIKRMELMTLFPTFVTELEFQDFAGIKIVMDYLLANKKVTQPVYNVVLSLFLEQGIDLNNLK
jgi:hypothetical protein